jgi:hypothetical protein
MKLNDKPKKQLMLLRKLMIAAKNVSSRLLRMMRPMMKPKKH